MTALLLLLWSALALAAETWTVAPGETLPTIARALGDPALVTELARVNGLSPDAALTPGQVLELPAGSGGVSAELLHAQGSVTSMMPGQIAVPIEAGRRLLAGTTVCTGPDGFAALRLATTGVQGRHDDVNLLPGTCLTVERASSGAQRRASIISVLRGSVTVRTSDDGAGTVTVRTPSGMTTGEHGGFRVSVETGAARTEAVEQPVSVLGGGDEVQVGAGEGTRVRTGERPDAPTPLLRPGPLVTPPDSATLYRPDFRWVAVDRALGYRLEISSSADFLDLLVVEVVDEELWSPTRLLLPYRVEGLWWRVSPIDRTGFVGVPTRARALSLPAGLGP